MARNLPLWQFTQAFDSRPERRLLVNRMYVPPIQPPTAGAQPTVPQGGSAGPPQAAPIQLTDAVAMTPKALAQATELRTQQVLGKVTEILARLESELFRSLGRASEFPAGKADISALLRADRSSAPPPSPGSALPSPPTQVAPAQPPAAPVLPDQGLPQTSIRPGLNIPQGSEVGPPVSPQTHTPQGPASSPSGAVLPSAQVQETAARAIELIARLAKVAPRTAEALLARHQAIQIAFPQAGQTLLHQLSQRTDSALADFVRQLLQPSATPNRPTSVPQMLASVFNSPAEMGALLQRAARIADLVRSGASPAPSTAQARVAVPPAGSATGGPLGGNAVSVLRAPLPQVNIASNPLVPAEALLSAVAARADATIDTVTLSRPGHAQAAAPQPNPAQSASQIGATANAGMATAVGPSQVGVLVNLNQILAAALGEANPLNLSETQIQAGIEFLQGQAMRGPRGAGLNPMLDRVTRSLADMLVSLRRDSPEAFERVMTMLRSLAALNPGNSERLLLNLESQLRQIVEFQRALQQPGQPLNLPGNAAAPGGGMGGTASLLVDVDVSQRLDLIVQDLRSRGVDARALQGQSQIEINARLTFAEQQDHDSEPLVIDLVAETLLAVAEGAIESAAQGRIEDLTPSPMEERALFGSREGRRGRVRLS